jgi:glutamate racemase
MNNAPIGVFDSGFGGLTVLHHLRLQLPQFDYLYLGDNARAPYGSHSFDVIYHQTLQCVEYLFSQGCELVLLACNTASARALRTIQQNDLKHYPSSHRVLGIVRPTVEAIASYTLNNNIGIVATEGTVKSNSYIIEIEKLYPHIKVAQEACPLWVPLVEQHCTDDLLAGSIIQSNIDNLLQQNSEIDTLVLACTHYPLLLETIKKHLPKHIKIVTQGELLAASLVQYFERHQAWHNRLSSCGTATFLTTDSSIDFDQKGSYFLGENVRSQSIKLPNI